MEGNDVVQEQPITALEHDQKVNVLTEAIEYLAKRSNNTKNDKDLVGAALDSLRWVKENNGKNCIYEAYNSQEGTRFKSTVDYYLLKGDNEILNTDAHKQFMGFLRADIYGANFKPSL